MLLVGGGIGGMAAALALAGQRHRAGGARGRERGVELDGRLELVLGALPLAAQREEVAQREAQAGVLGIGADLPLYPLGVLGHRALAQSCKRIAHEAASSVVSPMRGPGPDEAGAAAMVGGWISLVACRHPLRGTVACAAGWRRHAPPSPLGLRLAAQDRQPETGSRAAPRRRPRARPGPWKIRLPCFP
ncbi:hypothetical protein ACEN8K_14430 [Variovorax sp. CT11-76]